MLSPKVSNVPRVVLDLGHVNTQICVVLSLKKFNPVQADRHCPYPVELSPKYKSGHLVTHRLVLKESEYER